MKEDLIKYLISRPIGVFMTLLAILLIGLSAYLKIPTSLMPDVSIPRIAVKVSYPNSSARQIENLIVKQLKGTLSQTRGLDRLESQTIDGQAVIWLTLNFQTNPETVLAEVNEKVDRTLKYLPKGLERPNVYRATANDIPSVYLSISKKSKEEDFQELSDFIEFYLRKRIEQLSSVSVADLSGQSKLDLRIIPNPKMLVSLGLKVEDIKNGIEDYNTRFDKIAVQDGIYTATLNFDNTIENLDDIRDIIIKVDDKLVSLKQLAQVKVVPSTDFGEVYVNGKKSLVLAITKQFQSKYSDFENELNSIVNSFETDYPNLEFNLLQNQSKLLKVSIGNLKNSLLIAIILSFTLMPLFFNDFKSSLLIGTSIPICLLISFLLMYFFKMSINIVSLSGLILGVGMMIDNSIILLDSIIYKINQGYSLLDACCLGTIEIFSPLLTSVLTNCSVFIPLIFISGITGVLFLDQALTITFGLVSSLLVSIFVLPILFYHFKQLSAGKSSFSVARMIGNANLLNYYNRFFNFFFKNKIILYVIVFLHLFGACFLLLTMNYSLLPKFSGNEAVLNIKWNDNTNTKENTRRVTEYVLKDLTNLNQDFAQIGKQQFISVRDDIIDTDHAKVYLKASTEQEMKNIKNIITTRLGLNYPNCDFSFSRPENIFEYIFDSTNETKGLRIYSASNEQLTEVDFAFELDSLLVEDGFSRFPMKYETAITVDYEKLLLYDVDYETLMSELKTAFKGLAGEETQIDNNQLNTFFSYEREGLEQRIKPLFIKNSNNVLVPVESLIEVNSKYGLKVIQGDERGEYMKFNLDNLDANKVAFVDSLFLKRDDLIVEKFEGNQDLTERKYELTAIICFSLLLLFLIVAAQFESLKIPLIILAEIPINVGGSLFLLSLFGGTINLMSFIGIAVMSGVVVNDSILKLYQFKILMNEGFSLFDAIKIGSVRKLKPILITSLTTIVAIIPFLFLRGFESELQRPLALTVIGGLISGTFMSLFFLPVVFYQLLHVNKND